MLDVVVKLIFSGCRNENWWVVEYAVEMKWNILSEKYAGKSYFQEIHISSYHNYKPCP
jgi:hypothetical protein